MEFTLPSGTPEGQRRAVEADEKLITVGAGAGTGKTWVLSRRYLRLLLEDKEILPAGILTLTYTEAAAGEMKERIESLVAEALEGYHDEERKREIEDGLSDIWISTIHSFAARLIRESGLKLDIDPMASVISPHQEQAFWEDVKNAAEFGNLGEMARSYGDKRLQSLAKFLDGSAEFAASAAKWKSGTLSQFARKTAELHASSGYGWEDMLRWSESSDMIDATRPMVEEILCEEWRDVWEFWRDITLPDAPKPDSAGGRLNDLLAWQKAAHPGKDAFKNFYIKIMSGDYIKTPGGKQKEPFLSLPSRIGMTLGKWRKTRSERILDVTSGYEGDFHEKELMMRAVLMKFCALTWGMWDMMKQRRGLLSFSDMIKHARAVIDSGGVSRTFKHILVDEFQDTDRLQNDMIKALSPDSGLFVVGDPKQSIYKFRHADPSLFAETIRDADTRVELDVSFRTRSSLLERINKLFASIWRDGLGRSDSMQGLKYEPLNPALDDSLWDEKAMPDFKVILARCGKKADEARERLADSIARKILSWVREGRTIWDKHEGKTRSVMFSDFAILSRSRSGFEILEDALGRYGIDSVRDRSDDYFGRGELSDIVCMLRAAADSGDGFAVAGWLMSPFSGVKEEDAVSSCLEILDGRKRPADVLKANLPDACSRLEYLSLLGGLEGPAGLLYHYDRNRSWLSCYKPVDRLRVLRNFRHAISIAHDFQTSGTSGLTACAEWLTRALKSSLSMEEPSWHGKDENAVRLGAVHSAKGLEYPVTIIFEQRVRKNYDRDSIRPSRNLGIAFKDIPDELKADETITPQGFLWERLLSEQGDSEEETRLFYVAATRAQDSLIYCGLVDANDEPHKGTWTKLLLEHAENLSIEYADDDQSVPEANVHEDREDPRVLEVVKTRNSLRQISATSFALFEFCPFAWRRSYKQGLSLTWELETRNDDEESYTSGGARLGSLTHWVLSNWPKGDDYASELEHLLHDREVLVRLPVSLRGAWRDEKAKKDLQVWLLRFADTELFMRLRREHVRREFRFRHRLNDETMLAGSIDASFGDNLIDYKITSIDSVPEGLYESQMDFYALAMHELHGFESVNSSIVFLREGRVSERIISDFDSIRERVVRAAEICASGPYNESLTHCSVCPFKKGCVKHEGSPAETTE